MKYRIVTHPHMNATLEELDRAWCIDDICECHEVLDEIDLSMERARNK